MSTTVWAPKALIFWPSACLGGGVGAMMNGEWCMEMLSDMIDIVAPVLTFREIVHVMKAMLSNFSESMAFVDRASSLYPK